MGFYEIDSGQLAMSTCTSAYYRIYVVSFESIPLRLEKKSQLEKLKM